MIRVKGNKQIDLEENSLKQLSKEYEETIVDLGTGDGRFIYKSALENPKKLYIGIDPAAKQLEIYSKKAQRKKLHNAVFLVGAVETLIESDLTEIADKMYIYLPWGSLLQHLVIPNIQMDKNISNVLKPESNLEIVLGYSLEREPSETERLNLPEITEDYINQEIAPKLKEFGNLELVSYKTLEKPELSKIETSWGKKLTYGTDRPIYKLIFKKVL